MPHGFDGKRRRKKVTGRTKTEVRDQASQVRADLVTTGTAGRGDMTIHALMDEYLAVADMEVKRSTIETYSR